MKRLLAMVLAVLAVSCSGTGTAGSLPTRPAPEAHALDARGPGDLTLDQEVGAVMMVGFRGALKPEILEDWRLHQYGGFLVVNENANPDPQGYIRQLRAVSAHRLLAATDQEGGTVCLELASVPCLAGARETADSGASMRQMSAALRTAGFDVNLAPVADVWSGGNPFMRERSYGGDPALVSGRVRAAVEGVHAAGLLGAAKHFPGHGSADGNSHFLLPAVGSDPATLRQRDWAPFRAATGAGVDFTMVGHLDVPALDATQPASVSPAVIAALRQEVGFRGAVISDDMQMKGLTNLMSTPEGCVRFLGAGGDMVIVAHDPDVYRATYDAIKQAVTDGRLPRARLDDAVGHLLALHATS